MEAAEFRQPRPEKLRFVIMRDQFVRAPAATIARQARQSISQQLRPRLPPTAISSSRLRGRTIPRRLPSNEATPEFDPRPTQAALRRAARSAPEATVRSDDAGRPRTRPGEIHNPRCVIRRARPQDMRWRRRNRNQRRLRPARHHSSSDAAASFQIPMPYCSVRLPLLIYLPSSKFSVEKPLRILFISRSNH